MENPRHLDHSGCLLIFSAPDPTGSTSRWSRRLSKRTADSQKDKTKKFRRGDRLTVVIERLSIGGRGVARYEGLVIFTPDTAANEQVEVELVLVKKNFAEGRLLKILKPSPARRSPPCPWAGPPHSCGGCNWQHLEYEEQLKQKRDLIFEAFSRIGGLKLAPDQVRPVIPSPQELHYRNRIQLHHSGPRLGFHQRGSHEIVPIETCLIADARLNNELPRLTREHAHKKAGRFEIFVDQNGSVSSRENGNESSDENSEDTSFSPFSQVNSGQNEQLIRFVVDLFVKIAESRPRVPADKFTVLDLYAGSGNFSFPIGIALKPLKLIAVELNRESVARAQAEAKTRSAELGSTQFEFIAQDVGAFLTAAAADTDLVNALVLLDPPRTGCEPIVIEQLLALRPQNLVYVSCHPATLARDLKAFAAGGYEPHTVQPFDMFPQTDHVETVVHLIRRPGF